MKSKIFLFHLFLLVGIVVILLYLVNILGILPQDADGNVLWTNVSIIFILLVTGAYTLGVVGVYLILKIFVLQKNDTPAIRVLVKAGVLLSLTLALILLNSIFTIVNWFVMFIVIIFVIIVMIFI